jgi:hypothetical protein
MTPKLEYDGWVKRFNWATSAVSAACVLLFAGLAVGQINAAPPSVTSMGFGGRTFNGAPPSVTFLGPARVHPWFQPSVS